MEDAEKHSGYKGYVKRGKEVESLTSLKYGKSEPKEKK
jgi:hypothetical protein